MDEGTLAPAAAAARRHGPLSARYAVATSERSAVVDNARAIGIVLVVVGHAPAIERWLGDAIFAFHMPLFFFLSGLVVAPQALDRTWARRTIELARTLLTPYLFFFGIAWLYWLLAKRHGLRAAEFEALPWWAPLSGLSTGTGDALYVDPALWFFPCLFVTAIVYHALRKVLAVRTAFAVCACGAYALIRFRPVEATPLPWSIDCAVVALAFYAAGPMLKAWCVRASRGRVHRVGNAAVAGLGLAICIASPFVTGHVDLSHLAFGARPSLYLPVAACGTLAVILVAGLLPSTRFARWLSVNTVVIFPLHMLFFSVVTGALIVVFGRASDFKEIAGIGWLYVAAALAASWVASSILERVVPWLFRRGASTRGVHLAPVASATTGGATDA